jgi:hypothetical protein
MKVVDHQKPAFEQVLTQSGVIVAAKLKVRNASPVHCALHEVIASYSVLVGTPRGLSSEREPNLHFQPPIIRGFEEPVAIGRTGDLVRAAEQRRCDVADDRSGVGMIQNVLYGHRKGHIVTVAGLRCPNQGAQAPAPSLRASSESQTSRAVITRDRAQFPAFSNLSIPRAPQRGQTLLKQLSEEMFLFDGDQIPEWSSVGNRFHPANMLTRVATRRRFE